jgi:hypothetical protein
MLANVSKTELPDTAPMKGTLVADNVCADPLPPRLSSVIAPCSRPSDSGRHCIKTTFELPSAKKAAGPATDLDAPQPAAATSIAAMVQAISRFFMDFSPVDYDNTDKVGTQRIWLAAIRAAAFAEYLPAQYIYQRNARG